MRWFNSANGLTVMKKKLLSMLCKVLLFACFLSIFSSCSMYLRRDYRFWRLRSNQLIFEEDTYTSDGMVVVGECSFLPIIRIPSHVYYDGKKYTVTKIADNAFKNEANLKRIFIPKSVKDIGCNAFYGSGIYNNEKNWKNNALYISKNLIAVHKSAEGTYEVAEDTRVIASQAFANCNFEKVVIPASVSHINTEAFENCRLLQEVVMHEGLLEIEEEAFRDCHSLTSVIIPKSVNLIRDRAFYDCTSLESIVLSPSITHVPVSCFHGCISLKSIEIPNNVKWISEYAFSDCKSLEKIVLPRSLKVIDAYAFSDSKSLKTIVCHAMTPPEDKLWMCHNVSKSRIKLYVPAQAIPKYKDTYSWRQFGKILPIED